MLDHVDGGTDVPGLTPGGHGHAQQPGAAERAQRPDVGVHQQAPAASRAASSDLGMKVAVVTAMSVAGTAILDVVVNKTGSQARLAPIATSPAKC